MGSVIVVVDEEEGMLWVQWVYRMDSIWLEGVSHGKVMSIVVEISKMGVRVQYVRISLVDREKVSS
jgi:hypothetical protein